MLLHKIAALFRLKPKLNPVNTPVVAPQPTPDLALKIQINLDYLREMSMGDEDFVVEIIHMFIGQIPANLQKLLEFTHNQQWKELKELTHKMKSSMMLIGIKELEEIFVDLQLYAVNPGKTALIEPMVLRAKQICEIAIEDLKVELKELENQHA